MNDRRSNSDRRDRPARRDDRRPQRGRGPGRPPREDRSQGSYVPATSGRGSVHGPPVDDDAVIKELDPPIRRELSTLPGTLAEKVAGHLVMAGRLIDDDPETALAHARTAHDLAPRILAVRESLAIAAYATGDYRTAMREARTVRRMSGDDSWLPLIADCERGLGRPDRALDLLAETDLDTLPDEVRAECLIVLSGARRDLEQYDAAVAALDVELLRAPWAARLRVAYADALAAAGDEAGARQWLRLAAASDPEGVSGAAERLGAPAPEIVDVAEPADPGEGGRA